MLGLAVIPLAIVFVAYLFTAKDSPDQPAPKRLSAYAEVLKVERVGVLDNFFELGGHSLLATQIASRVQKALQRNVPLRAMFECSTVEELASYIEAQAASAIDERKAARLDDLMSQLEML